MENRKKLYKVISGYGEWYVIAEHPTEAEQKYIAELRERTRMADEKKSIATEIHFIAETTIKKISTEDLDSRLIIN